MAGLYIHIPFCHSKCSYCDFYSTPNLVMMGDYINALIAELKLRINEITDIETIYIGGGTPSILPIELLRRLVYGIYDFSTINAISEFTIESNPEDVTIEWIKEVKSLGINRVSIGLQSFSDDQLKIINRRHSSLQSEIAIARLRDGGITNISGDLIYGLPGQDLNSWNFSLDKLLSFNLPHISAYMLSYEPGTRLYAQLISGKITEASEELVTQMYELLIEKTRDIGYDHYEVSNFALNGYHAIHNSNYWSNVPYLGLGVSSHSFDGRNRRYNPSKINDYINNIANGSPYFILETESEDERYNDYIITSLRTNKGVDINYVSETWGISRKEDFLKIAEKHIETQKMTQTESNYYIPEKYLLISDAIMRDFIIV